MTHATLLLAAILLQAPPPAPAPAAADRPAPRGDAEAPPSPKDVQQALADGDPSEALRLVSRLLTLKGKAAQGLDRYELLSLKAEGHLRLRAGDAAAQALKAAAEQTDNAEKAAVARATEQLIRRSRGLTYTPKRQVKGKVVVRDPLDITDPRQRKAALAAMFADEMAELSAKVKAARAARTIPPTVKAIQAARELATLELAVNGSADQVNGVVDDLTVSTKDLLTRILEHTGKRVDQITRMANDPERVRQVIPLPYGGFDVQVAERARGLKRQDIGELKTLADTCDEVAAAGKAVRQASGSDESVFEDVIEEAGDLRMHIRRMLRGHDVDY